MDLDIFYLSLEKIINKLNSYKINKKSINIYELNILIRLVNKNWYNI